MNAKSQSVARRAIACAQSIPILTSPAWKGRANRTALALAAAAVLLPLATQAAKPPKPPSSPAFVPVALGQTATDLNNAGQVVGSTTIPGYPDTYEQACLLNPRDTDGNGRPDTWFADQNADGQNDLIIPLGTLPGSTYTCASAVNDLGLVVGTALGTKAAFIVVPEDGLWYQDVNGDGINDLMQSLGALPGRAGWIPSDITINNLGQVTGWSYDPNNSSLRGGFLLNPVEVAPGVWQWFQDDGTGANALMQSLGSFVPTSTRSINDRGQIVGALAQRATLRQPDGTLVDLGAGALPSWGVVINNAGQIGLTFKVVEPLERAGLLTPLDTNGDGVPDLWSRDLNGDGVNDLIVDIGAVQNLNGSALRGLNDAGSAVGYSWNATGRIGMKRVSFLWENGQLQTLSSLTGGVIEFRFAKAINNARQILTEYYILLPIQ